MQKNKYKSHEDYRSVWLNIWGQDEGNPIGKIEIHGDTDWGYRLCRRGRLFGKNLAQPNICFQPNIIFGYADFFFTKRKDAENIALVLAMYFSGDLKDKSLLDPAIFNGVTRPIRNHRIPIDSLPLSEARTELFWKGVDHVDPSEGWIEIDPDNILGKLTLDEPLPRDYNDDDKVNLRGFLISEVSDAIVEYYAEWFLTSKVKLPLHEVFSRVEDCGQISVADRGYVTLLAIAKLKNNIPVEWVFAQQRDEVKGLIPRLWSNLPTDVIAYVEECELEAKHYRDRQVKICNLKAKILAQLTNFILKEDRCTQAKIHCCVTYLCEVRAGSSIPPCHSDADFNTLMKKFVDKAILNEDEAINWLASKLVLDSQNKE